MKLFIPTPSHSAVGLGPLTIHYYALCIVAGVVVAIALGRARYAQRGGDVDEVIDCAIVAIPAGIIGGRLYHLITSPDQYFGTGGHPLDALKIWDGGMGIWGAIALGTLASWLTFRRRERSLTFGELLDALAPGLLLAQALGRFGNWFNGELFGRPTRFPWALEIPPNLRPSGFENYSTFHPTFLYEALWCVLAAGLLIWLGSRFTIEGGSLFLAYIAIYCLGRSGIEYLRIDQAHQFLGLRLNEWVSFGGLVLSLFTLLRRHQRLSGVGLRDD